MKKIKNLFLFVFLVSTAIFLSTHITFLLENNFYYMTYNGNIFTKPYYYLEPIKKDKSGYHVERDYFKSNWFSDTIIKDLLMQLNSSVANPDKYNDSAEYRPYHDDGKTEREVLKEQKKESREFLEGIKNVDYFAVNNSTNEVFTNTKYKNIEEFEKKANRYYQIKFSDNNLDYRKVDGKKYKSASDFKYNLSYRDEVYIYENISIYLSVEHNVKDDKNFYFNYDQYERMLQKYDICVMYGEPALICSIISLLIYMIINLRTSKTKSWFWNYYNKIPLEFISLLLIIDIGVIVGMLLSENTNINQLCVIPIFLLLFYIALFIKQIHNLDKKSDFFKTSIIYKICHRILHSMKVFLADSREMIINSTKIDIVKKIVILAIGCIFAEIIFGLFLASAYISFFSFVIIFGVQFVFLVYLVKRLSYLNEIMIGIEKIKNGQVNHKIENRKDPLFSKLANDVNNIGDGLENSIEEKIKSERMKSELITNVSHDLKTPLTSIINYIQIIKKENIEPAYINDYVNILDNKSKRLKTLIEDLFEASKASTGNIELQLEKLDMKQLLRQTIGELEDRLEEQNLTLKVNLTDEDTFVLADGKSLYRVFENLLSNICKYTMQNTRVYIDLIKEDDNIIVNMKNISSYELNFDPEEIIDRFKRADESRNTEGSGLGLAIARDLTVLQGGLLTVDIDGDLFKVRVEMKEYSNEN